MLNDISLPAAFRLRPAQAKDQAFMEQLFRSTREYLYSLALPEEAIDILVSQQYRLQQAAYAVQSPEAYTLIIQLSGKAIGKVTLDESARALHIIDFILEPDMRGKRYGTLILNAIQADAEKRRIPVKLSVDRQNVLAKKLYLRLGFQVTGVSATHESMVLSLSAFENFPGVISPGNHGRGLPADAQG